MTSSARRPKLVCPAIDRCATIANDSHAIKFAVCFRAQFWKQSLDIELTTQVPPRLATHRLLVVSPSKVLLFTFQSRRNHSRRIITTAQSCNPILELRRLPCLGICFGDPTNVQRRHLNWNKRTSRGVRGSRSTYCKQMVGVYICGTCLEHANCWRFDPILPSFVGDVDS